MRRQMRLILKILAYVESTMKIGKIPLPKCDDYTQDEIAYHVLLCSDAGYLCIRKGDHNHMPTDIIRLTWCGHKALETMTAEGVGRDPG